MPNRASSAHFASLLLSLLLAGCGGDSGGTTEPGILALSAREQQAAAGQASTPAAITLGALVPDLSSAAIARLGQDISLTVSAAGAASAAVTIPVDRTTACPAGGSARSVGTLTGTLAAGGSGSLTAALTQTLLACGVTVDGRTLLISSDPTLTTTASYAVVSRAPSDQQEMRVAGNTMVSVSGSRIAAVPCGIDVTVTTTASTRSASMTGTFCGAAVSQTFTWTP